MNGRLAVSAGVRRLPRNRYIRTTMTLWIRGHPTFCDFGTYDSTLIYRLNAIHIEDVVSNACKDVISSFDICEGTWSLSLNGVHLWTHCFPVVAATHASALPPCTCLRCLLRPQRATRSASSGCGVPSSPRAFQLSRLEGSPALLGRGRAFLPLRSASAPSPVPFSGFTGTSQGTSVEFLLSAPMELFAPESAAAGSPCPAPWRALMPALWQTCGQHTPVISRDHRRTRLHA